MKQGEGEVELGEMGGYLRRDKGEERRPGLKPGKDRKSQRRVKRDEGVAGRGVGDWWGGRRKLFCVEFTKPDALC